MIPLTRVTQELVKIVGNKTAVPNYRQLYLKILDGTIDAYQKPNGRYLIDRSNLPQIIELFGLEKTEA